jgi:hypothetical protein
LAKFVENQSRLQVFLIPEGLELVFRLVLKTSGGRITPSVAGSIPALSAAGAARGASPQEAAILLLRQ